MIPPSGILVPAGSYYGKVDPNTGSSINAVSDEGGLLVGTIYLSRAWVVENKEALIALITGPKRQRRGLR